MQTIFQAVLAAHIASGFAGLLSGTAIMALPKGGKIHHRLGRAFFYAMTGIFATSIYLSLARQNWFLLCIGFFSFYLAASGYRILYLKPLRRFASPPGFTDHLLGTGGLLAGAGMLVLAVALWQQGNAFGVVPGIFGSISMVFAILGYLKWVKPPVQKTHWIRGHALRMAGAFTSTVTAFVVVNVQTGPGWLWWLLPTAIIIPVAVVQMRRFLAGKSRVKPALAAFVALLLLTGQGQAQPLHAGWLSVQGLGQDFAVKLQVSIAGNQIDIRQPRVLPGMEQPLLYTQNAALHEGRVSGTLVLLGSRRLHMQGYATADSLMIALFEKEGAQPAGKLVAGNSPVRVSNLPLAARQMADTIRHYIYNKNELATPEWKAFSQMLSLYGGYLQDDLEFFAAVNREIGKLPFSHMRFTKMPYAGFASTVNGAYRGDDGASLSYPAPGAAMLAIPSFGGSGSQLSALMQQVIDSGAPNLIIDLRQNSGGGAGATLQLVKYLAARPEVAGALLTNRWFDTTLRLPTPADYAAFYRFAGGHTLDLIAALGQHAGVVLEVQPAPSQFKGKVFVLTSRQTASACEPLVYALKRQGLATIVGENTAGKMLSAGAYYLSTGYLLSLPVADYYTVDGVRLEGQGVTPDIFAPAAEALERVLQGL